MVLYANDLEVQMTDEWTGSSFPSLPPGKLYEPDLYVSVLFAECGKRGTFIVG